MKVMGIPGGLVVENPPANAGDVGSIPGLGKSPGKGNGNSSILAWKVPWTEEPGGLQSMESQKSQNTYTHTPHTLECGFNRQTLGRHKHSFLNNS